MRLTLLSLTLCTAIWAAPISNIETAPEDAAVAQRSAPFHTPETFPGVSEIDPTTTELESAFGQDGIPIKRTAPFHTPETFPGVSEIDPETTELESGFGEAGIPVVRRS